MRFESESIFVRLSIAFFKCFRRAGIAWADEKNTTRADDDTDSRFELKISRSKDATQ